MKYLIECFNTIGKRVFYAHYDNLKDALKVFNDDPSDDNEVITLSQKISGSWTTQFNTGAYINSQYIIIEVKGIDVEPHKLMTFCIDDSNNSTVSKCSVYLRQFKA